ncbi:unnamed protein product, partial [Rotaria sordida]
QFNDLCNCIPKSSLYNTSNRTSRMAIGALLMKLRLALSHETLAVLLGLSDRKTVSNVLQSARVALMKHFVLQHLGFEHISRRTLIDQRTRPLAKILLADNNNDKAILVLDSTYIYLVQQSNELKQYIDALKDNPDKNIKWYNLDAAGALDDFPIFSYESLMDLTLDLQRKLKEIGYEIGPFPSKDTLSNIIRLHSLSLTEHGLAVGPVTNHTRSIYQRKLLEVLTNETSEGKEDEIETEIPISKTPSRTIRSSITRTADNDITSSPGRLYTQDVQEPRTALTRVDIENKNKHNLSIYYPNVSNTKPKSEQTITHSYSPQRSSTKTELHHNTMSYGLRNSYDFQNDEPTIIRHEHKATPFCTTNISSGEIFSTNTNRYTKQSDMPTTTRNDLNEIRSRILTNTNEEKEIQIKKDLTPKKSTFINQSENKKLSNNNEKLDVPVKNNGTFLYSGITIAVALIVFVLYLWFEK